MTELKICAMASQVEPASSRTVQPEKPSLLSDCRVWIETQADGTPELNLQLYNVVWPTDPDKMRDFAEKLSKISDQLLAGWLAGADPVLKRG